MLAALAVGLTACNVLESDDGYSIYLFPNFGNGKQPELIYIGSVAIGPLHTGRRYRVCPTAA